VRIVKLTDKVYGSSLANFHSSYEGGFPQREQFLFQELQKLGVEFMFYRHKDLRDFDNILDELKIVEILVEGDDTIVVDNPMSALLIPETFSGQIIFDCVDWYEEMYQKEFSTDKLGLNLIRDGLRFLWRKATKILCQSSVMKEWVQKHNPIAKIIENIPNGYDDKLFFPQLCVKEDCQKMGTRIAVYVGKLGSWYEKIFDIIDEVNKSLDWKLYIVGDGPLGDKVKGRMIQGKTVFVGRVPLKDVPIWMNDADVCVFPVNDDSPLATTEYMTCGKPVVHFGKRISWLVED
jgi:glycosyltransferase involved in cell wall biosynthesis